MKKIILIIAILLPLLTIPLISHAFGGSTGGGTVSLDNPLGEGATDPNILVGKVIQMVLGVVGSLALLMFVYGGFVWMLAAGNNERVQKGKDILIWATIGLVVIFSAYALVKMIFQGLGIK